MVRYLVVIHFTVADISIIKFEPIRITMRGCSGIHGKETYSTGICGLLFFKAFETSQWLVEIIYS